MDPDPVHTHARTHARAHPRAHATTHNQYARARAHTHPKPSNTLTLKFERNFVAGAIYSGTSHTSPTPQTAKMTWTNQP